MGLVISEGLRLKSYNTPAAIAGVAPTLDYRFALDRREIEAISLTDKLTYTGATNGTFVNRAGLIERATTDQPRFDHGPLSRQSLGLLVEEQRTNLLLRSEEFNNASWTTNAQNVAVSANQAVAPDGASAADLLTNTGSSQGFLQQNTTVADATVLYTLSVFVKSNGAAQARVITVDGASSGARLTFTFSTKTLLVQNVGTNGANATGSFIEYPNGWYKLIVTGRTTAAGTLRLSQITSAKTAFGTANEDGTSGLYLWGAQLEAGAFPTSYIPTTTTALTRPVDSAVIDGTGVITGTYTLVEKPAGCAVVNGSNIDLVSGFTAERVMVFPAALSAPQITAIRGAM
jgi:hypothetical protein